MRFLSVAPDGGKDSGVTGFYIVEIKPLFSLVLLHFRKGTNETLHSHAFNALTLWLKGTVKEHLLDGSSHMWFAGQVKYTSRDCFHNVEAMRDTWAISLRGPWAKTWRIFRNGKFATLAWGRKVVG